MVTTKTFPVPAGSKVTASAVAAGKVWLGTENGTVSVLSLPDGESACAPLQPYKKSITALTVVGTNVWVASQQGTATPIDQSTHQQAPKVTPQFVRSTHLFTHLFALF